MNPRISWVFKAGIIVTIAAGCLSAIGRSRAAPGRLSRTNLTNPEESLPAPGQITYQTLGESSQENNPLFQPIPQVTPATTELTPPKDTICSQIWGAYPPEGTLPLWLSTPKAASGLRTDIPYTLLAGHLIQAGLVNAQNCPAAGLLSSGAANTCGMERARPMVTEWQNQFDPIIWEVAVRNAIPAVLLKRLLAQESQFWFGPSLDETHYGPGQITEAGLDPLFIWYPNYYHEVCENIFSSSTCEKRYDRLSKSEKALIRGYFLTNRIEIGCPTCPLGFDITKVPLSMDIIAKLVVSNCHQVNQMISNITEVRPANVSNYEDLWCITMGNYNAGGGCLSEALKRAYQAYPFLNWANVSGQLSPLCDQAIDYVDLIR